MSPHRVGVELTACDPGVPLQPLCEQPSNIRLVYKCFWELSELVHRSLYILNLAGRPLKSHELLDNYMRYLQWYDRLPEALRLGENFTPAVFFVQYVSTQDRYDPTHGPDIS